MPRFHFDPLRKDIPATATRERIDVWVSGWSINATEDNQGRRIAQMRSLLRQLEGRFPARRLPEETSCRVRLVDELWGIAREFACDPTTFAQERERISAKARHVACRDIEIQIEGMGLHRTARSHGVRQHLTSLFDRAKQTDHDDPLREGFVLAATSAYMSGLGAVSAERRSESLAMCMEELHAGPPVMVPRKDQGVGGLHA